MELAKVWPLRPGLEGVTVEGRRALLQPGIPGFMEYAAAVIAQSKGELQLMAGETPESLRKPVYENRRLEADGEIPLPKRARKTYTRRDMAAEKPGS